MAGFRYTNKEKQFLTNLVLDKKRDLEAMLKDAKCNGDSVIQQLIDAQLAVANSAMDKLTGAFAE